MREIEGLLAIRKFYCREGGRVVKTDNCLH